MMLSYQIAQELGMTVTRLLQEATEEELIGWDCFFQIKAESERRRIRQR